MRLRVFSPSKLLTNASGSLVAPVGRAVAHLGDASWPALTVGEACALIATGVTCHTCECICKCTAQLFNTAHNKGHNFHMTS
jgi:hypothetical protein